MHRSEKVRGISQGQCRGFQPGRHSGAWQAADWNKNVMSGREAYWGGKRKKTPLSTLKLVEPSKDKWYYSQPFSLEGNKVSFSSTFPSCCRSWGEVVLPVNSLTLKIKCSFTVSSQQESFTYEGKQVKFCAHKNVLASALGRLLQTIANPGKPAPARRTKVHNNQCYSPVWENHPKQVLPLSFFL